MIKSEFKAAADEHNRIVAMLLFEKELDWAHAVTSSFFDAYADEVHEFPEIAFELENLSSLLPE